ncbi:MAG: hypothetical protein ACYT04_34750 [Nostoc sp.]
MQKQSQYKKLNQIQEGSNGLTELSEEHEEQIVGGQQRPRQQRPKIVYEKCGKIVGILTPLNPNYHSRPKLS